VKGKAFVKGRKRRDKGFPYYTLPAKYTHLKIEIQNINRNAESPTEPAIALMKIRFRSFYHSGCPFLDPALPKPLSSPSSIIAVRRALVNHDIPGMTIRCLGVNGSCEGTSVEQGGLPEVLGCFLWEWPSLPTPSRPSAMGSELKLLCHFFAWRVSSDIPGT